MKKYSFIEIICVALVVLFIVFTVKDNDVTTKTADEIAGNILSVIDNDTLIERESEFIRGVFDIDLSALKSVVYYSSDDVMNVCELFVGVCSDSQSVDLSAVFESYAKDRFNLYNGYAPEQAAYLDNYVLINDSGVILFCVSENAQVVLDAFSEAV